MKGNIRKVSVAVGLITLSCITASGQGIELHRVFGTALFPKAERPAWTITAETAGIVRWGLLRARVYLHAGNKGVEAAYGEFVQEWRTGVGGFAVQTEYNGGLHNGKAYGEALLIGPAYRWDSQDFSRSFAIAGLYRYLPGNTAMHGYQLACTWEYIFGNGLFSFRGFAKAWRETLDIGGYHGWAEPQIWLNLGALPVSFLHETNLSLGGEASVRYTLGAPSTFHAIPSAAIRFTF
ncbi:MAG: DUF5020 family protein [Tannerellaceae bacterium]|jgi:hypothetical protein|nr:DUF5020 family protein [Tannerellaceae bacterium]